MPMFMAGDLTGAWTKLLSFDNTANPLYIQDIRKDFIHERFDPKTETIQVFLNRLLDYQYKISTTQQPISDDEVYTQLLNALPETEVWQTQRNFIMFTNMNLQDALYSLQQTERIPRGVTNQSATANAVRGNLRGRGNKRGRGRGGKGRGEYHGNGEKYMPERGYTTLPNSGKGTKTKPYTCKFCRKKGHWQDACWEYNKAREALHSDKKTDNDGFARVAIADEYTGSLYPHTTMRAEVQNDIWILDSGASHHFTGSIENLTNVTYWDVPRKVKTVNHVYATSTAYGIATIGNLTLRDVWYVKDFRNNQLISVGTLALPFGEAGMLSTAITPYEAMYGRQPDFKKLRIFGCKA